MGDKRVVIIGAGVSGLIAARQLEQAGLQPVILEAQASVGGRLQTDMWEGLPLDHGFQVLLTAYPAVKKYLDVERLRWSTFQPGAVVFTPNGNALLGDPLRQLSLLWTTLTAPIGHLGDKWKILQLSREMKRTSITQIFASPEMTTLAFLQQYGFSNRVIERFFRPFYSGIFLEPDLATSSRHFQFVFKMFAEGHAALPAAGIHAVPQQLADTLQQTTWRMSTPVKTVAPGRVTLKDGTQVEADAVLIATDPAHLLADYEHPPVTWHATTNLYFTAPGSTLARPMIGLMAHPDTVVNNFHFVSDVLPANRTLLSVSVVGDTGLDERTLISKVEQEMASHCGIAGLEHLRTYHVTKALPVLSGLQYQPTPEQVRHGNGIYLAGDYLANGSLNAAMLSGEVAAQAITQDFSITG